MGRNRRRFRRRRPGGGRRIVALYIGLEGDTAAAGATSANHWIYEQDDIGRVGQQPADEDAPGLFVSFPSQKDPAWQGPPTAEDVAGSGVQAAFMAGLMPAAAVDSGVRREMGR